VNLFIPRTVSSLYQLQSSQLQANVSYERGCWPPEDLAQTPAVTWSALPAGLATVTAGLVTAQQPGRVSVTARVTAFPSVSDTIPIDIIAVDLPVSPVLETLTVTGLTSVDVAFTPSTPIPIVRPVAGHRIERSPDGKSFNEVGRAGPDDSIYHDETL